MSDVSSGVQPGLLLHACCGPCAIAPVLRLREQKYAVTALFVNPNIQPLSEYLRRREAMVQCAEKLALPVLWRDDMWDMAGWLRLVSGKCDTGPARCLFCYTQRLEATAKEAVERGFALFSSSLLYSRHQRHEVIAEAGYKAGKKFGIPFYYEDYRVDWQKGIEISKEYEIYRQPYCGCVYSEVERYEKKFQKLLAKA